MLSETNFTRQGYEFMQDIAKKDYEAELQELRQLFLGSRYDNRPHFIIPTSESDLLRMRQQMSELDTQSMEFADACRTSLTSSEYLRLPKWREDLHIVALNNDELHALLRLRGKLDVQNPPAVEAPEPIMAQMPSLPAFRADADGNRVPFMAQGTEALARLKEMNPKIDTNFGDPPKSEKETNDDLAYYLQVQSSLSHLQTGIEDKIWEDQLQLIKSVKADYAKRVDSGELVPTGNMSYVDFIPNKDIPKMPELQNPPLAAPKAATSTQTPRETPGATGTQASAQEIAAATQNQAQKTTTPTPAPAATTQDTAATGIEAPATQEIVANTQNQAAATQNLQPPAAETATPAAAATPTPTPTPTHTPAVATPNLALGSQPAVLAPQHRFPFQQMYYQQFYAPQYGYQHP